jgi:hypothetical protein
MNWVEWADLTDGLGSPVIVGFICGVASVDHWHHGKSDREIALSATYSLEQLTERVKNSAGWYEKSSKL